MAGFHIENFGCRAARADGEAVSGLLADAGLLERSHQDADVVVVNTCSVTAEADRSARAFIRKAHRENPEARIVVTGCYAQRAPEELAALEGVAAVVGNSHKALAPEIILGLVRGAESNAVRPELVPVTALLGAGNVPTWVDDQFAHSFLEEGQLLRGTQTRPNLKIQEGCGNRCTFCVIPQTRGSSRSLSAAIVLRQVGGFVAAGGRELVLSGINLGRWGKDLPEKTNLPALVRAIVTDTGLARLRLSSIEPMDWDDELIALMREFSGTRIARHAHLPLQSGSDAVLRRMHRRYRPWHYAEKVEKLVNAAGPAVTIGADVMVGFPGETDAEFAETHEMVRALPFGYLHLFPFSPRPGTRGWALHAEKPVPGAMVDERLAALRALAAERMLRHRAQFVGTELRAITLHSPAALSACGRSAALTENFLPVEILGVLDANQLVRARIVAVLGDGELEGVVSDGGLSPSSYATATGNLTASPTP